MTNSVNINKPVKCIFKYSPWFNHDIRFVNIGGEMYAILKDLCGVTDLRADRVARIIKADKSDKIIMINKTCLYLDEPSTNGLLAISKRGILEALFDTDRINSRVIMRMIDSLDASLL